MIPKDYITVGLISYLLGSIPFGYILVRLFKKQDIRATGSGNIGATNVARSGAKGLAAATLVLDVAKGSAAVWIAQHYYLKATLDQVFTLTAFAALCVVAGHCFTVWLNFKGGKGVATALGAFLLLTPKGALVGLAVFIAEMLIFRFVSLGSIFGAIAIPVATYFFGVPGMTGLGFLTASCLVVIVKHHQNIRRLMSGTEPKLGVKSA